MRKTRSLIVYASLVVLAIVIFQLYWIFSAYDTQQKAIEEEARNIIREYVVNYDGLSLIQDMGGRQSSVPKELMDILKDSLSGGHVQVIIAGEDKPLPDTLLKKLLESGVNPSKFRNLDSQMTEGLNDKLHQSFPSMEFVLSVNGRGKKYDTANNLSNNTLMVASQLHPEQKYTLSISNLGGMAVRHIKWQIVVSLLYLSLCLTAFLLLVYAIKSNRRLMQMKDSFTNNMTHELKTPIATLYAAAEALDNPGVREDQNLALEYIHFMKEGLKKLSSMADTILLNAKLNKGKVYLDKQQVNLYSLIESVASKFSPVLQVHDAVLDISGVQDGIIITADTEHLGNVFSNLIDNAIKYNIRKPFIKINAVHVKDSVRIVFEDNGIGIDKRDQKEIFKPYVRVSEGDRHSIKGYGLGLSYVAEIITLHYGKIRVEKSEMGKGSTFEIILNTNE